MAHIQERNIKKNGTRNKTPTELNQNGVARNGNGTFFVRYCTLLARQSALILKLGMLYGWQSI